MRYYKDIQGGYVVAIGTGGGGEEITEEEYGSIMAAIQQKPPRTDDTDYHLTENLTWVAYERIDPPDESEPDAGEVLNVLLGGADD